MNYELNEVAMERQFSVFLD